jgi:sigma-B regulation protein RsbU (phosphoserine phosphatase)
LETGKLFSKENFSFFLVEQQQEVLLNLSIVPLKEDDQVIGIMAMFYDNSARAKAEQELKNDLLVAKQIQYNLIPKSYELVENPKIAVFYNPQSEVGGDIFDISHLSDGTLRMFIADATGHGVQAALTTMLIKSEYERLKIYELPVHEVLTRLNQVFYKQYQKLSVFFSAMILDLSLEEQVIYYSSAGHPEQLLIQGENWIKLRGGGKLIGLREQVDYPLYSQVIKPKDRLLIYTDGLMEGINPSQKELCEEDVFGWIKKNSRLDIEEFIQKLILDFYKFVGENGQQDDITLIAMEIADK